MKIARPLRKAQLSRARDWLFGALLVVSVLLAYRPVWHAPPVWDDDAHITQAALRSPEGLLRIWVEPGATQQYYPLVHSTFWLAHQFWGEDTLGYHLLNILLHAASCLLLVRILRRLEIPGAWLAAAIFALHPIEVESVAWISELKNTLSGVLYLSALNVYLSFDSSRRRSAYIAAFALFTLGLLAKSVIATLPAALLVIFWWKRGRISARRDALPLAPFFAIGITAGIFTAWMEHSVIGANGAEFALPLVERGLVAGRAFWFYLGKLVWPADLIFIYPRWSPDARTWWQYLYPLAACGLALAAWALRRHARWPLAAVLIFGGTLFPALGFLNVYPFRYSFVADHFQYLAGLAPIAVFAAGAAHFTRHLANAVRLGASIPPLLILAALSNQQCHAYAGYETLWRTTIAQNPGCWLAFNNLGTTLLAKGLPDEALASYRRAIALKPDYAEAHFNAANALAQKNQPADALVHYRTALTLQPIYPEAWLNLGTVLAREGRIAEALDAFQSASRQKPHYAEARYNLGLAFHRMGRNQESIAEFDAAIAARGDYPEAHRNIAMALVESRRIREAIAHYERVQELRPPNNAAAGELAWILATCPDANLRNGQRALALAGRAADLTQGSDPWILRPLAAACAEIGRFPEAIRIATRARALTPENSPLNAALAQELTFYHAGQAYRDPGLAPQP